MMKTLLTLMLAGIASAQLPVELMGRRSGLVRAGLVAGYDLRNTGDVQSVANLVSGGPALQRGSTAGADTNDPTPSLAGWVFDGVDDYATAPQALGPAPFSVMAAHRSLSDGKMVVTGNAIGGFGLQCLSDIARVVRLSKANVAGSTSSHFNQNVSTAVIRDSGSVYFYKNGATDGSGAAETPFVSGNIALGRVSNPNESINGTVYYLLIYNRAITAKEVRQNHNWLKAKMAEVGVTLP